MSEEDYETLARERRRIRELIERLEEKDKLLGEKQRAAFRSASKAHDAQESNKAEPPVIPELDQPLNQFWGQDKVALVSYPRSGNSLLRRLIEKLTGTVTGSDARPDRILVRQLAAMGMRGEGVMDSRVWCVKTHYPERVGRARLTVKRAILIVRNPFDAIASFFQMMLTDSHSQSVPPEHVLSYYIDLWNDFLLEELSIWVQFHAHWRQVRAPTLVVRYEDLVHHREVTVRKIAGFLYEPLFADGSVSHESVEQSITALLGVPLTEVGIYKPKAMEEQDANKAAKLAEPDSTSKWLPLDVNGDAMLKSLSYYTREQYRYVLAAARSDLVRFGYWNAAVHARPSWAPDLVPYEDVDPGGCMLEDASHLRLNSRYALRPRYEKDQYGRGFDVRWQERLTHLPPYL